MLELSRQGYDVTGLHIDLGIPGSSEIVRGVIERFCGKHGFKLIVKEMAKEGLAIHWSSSASSVPSVPPAARSSGTISTRRRLKGNCRPCHRAQPRRRDRPPVQQHPPLGRRLSVRDQGPRLDGEDGFARKVKPFWRLTEFETATYAFLEEIEHHHTPCPYSAGASFTYYKGLWNQLEEEMPGRKLSFYVDTSSAGVPPSPGSKGPEGDALAPAPSAATRHPPGCAASAASGKSSRKERVEIGRGRGPFWRRASPLPNPPLSPKTFGLIESLFPVFRKVKARGADRVRKEYFESESVLRSRMRTSRRSSLAGAGKIPGCPLGSYEHQAAI